VDDGGLLWEKLGFTAQVMMEGVMKQLIGSCANSV
jgi:hypothetical protein